MNLLNSIAHLLGRELLLSTFYTSGAKMGMKRYKWLRQKQSCPFEDLTDYMKIGKAISKQLQNHGYSHSTITQDAMKGKYRGHGKTYERFLTRIRGKGKSGKASKKRMPKMWLKGRSRISKGEGSRQKKQCMQRLCERQRALPFQELRGFWKAHQSARMCVCMPRIKGHYYFLTNWDCPRKNKSQMKGGWGRGRHGTTPWGTSPVEDKRSSPRGSARTS